MNLDLIINRNTWIISDHHFGHSKVEDFEPCRIKARKEDGLATFEEMLIKRHNEIVKPDDNVLFLGDFSFSSPANWAPLLNGRKHLVLGNHDRPAHTSYVRDFENVFKGIHYNINSMDFVNSYEDSMISAVITNIDDWEIMFCHYPVGCDDEYANSDKMKSRLSVLEKNKNSFFIDFCFHGHMHSNRIDTDEWTATGYINTSCEIFDFSPRKIGDLLDIGIEKKRAYAKS